MAYNRINHLKKIYFVQQYTLLMQKKGVKNTRIHKNIAKIHPMTLATFYNYLAVNAKAELRALKVDFKKLEEESKIFNSAIPEE